jgi:hypothetical protein
MDHPKANQLLPRRKLDLIYLLWPPLQEEKIKNFQRKQ